LLNLVSTFVFGGIIVLLFFGPSDWLLLATVSQQQASDNPLLHKIPSSSEKRDSSLAARNVLLRILGLPLCLCNLRAPRGPDLTTQHKRVDESLDGALSLLAQLRPGALRDADRDGNDETGLKHLLRRMFAPLADREVSVARLVEHPWLHFGARADLAEATIPLLLRPAPPPQTAAAPAPAAPVRGDEGLFRADLELVEAEVDGVGRCWLVLGVGGAVLAEWPWLRAFDPRGAARDGCVVTRIDGRGPAEHRDARGLPALRRGGPFGSRMELAVRYLPGAMAAWGGPGGGVLAGERTAVVLRTRPVHQDGPVWDPQRCAADGRARAARQCARRRRARVGPSRCCAFGFRLAARSSPPPLRPAPWRCVHPAHIAPRLPMRRGSTSTSESSLALS
jgi:hypothetical protein